MVKADLLLKRSSPCVCSSRNFLELNIFMRDLRVQHYEQLEAYTIVDLLSIVFVFVVKYGQGEQ